MRLTLKSIASIFSLTPFDHYSLKWLNKVMTDFYSIKEFSQELGVHPNTIRRHIARGRINAIHVGGIKKSIYRIPKSEFQRLAEKNLEKIVERIIEKRMQNNV